MIDDVSPTRGSPLSSRVQTLTSHMARRAVHSTSEIEQLAITCARDFGLPEYLAPIRELGGDPSHG